MHTAALNGLLWKFPGEGETFKAKPGSRKGGNKGISLA